MRSIKGMGIGTIILFIALLLTAAIASMVLIRSTTSLQETSLLTGKESRKDVASGFKIISIKGSDGTNGSIDTIEVIFTPHPGSDATHLSNLLTTVNTKNVSISLKFRDSNTPTANNNQGYNTWTTQELGELGEYYNLVTATVDDVNPYSLSIDLDLDGSTDTIVVCRIGRPHCDSAFADTHVLINLSSGPGYYIEVVDDSGSPVDLSAAGGTLANFMSQLGSHAFMSFNGATAPGGWRIDPNTINFYLAPTVLNEDLDDDQLDDSLVINDTHVILYLSSEGNTTLQLNNTQGLAYSLGVDLSSGAQTVVTNVTATDNASSTVYSYIRINGATSRASYIDANVSFQVAPYNINQGYFTVEHIQQGPRYRQGVASSGDTMRLFVQAPRRIYEDEEIQLLLIPRTGSRSTAHFFMPNVITEKIAHLYP